MDREFNVLAKKTAEYIEAVQPGLDKLASYDNEKKNFVKRATQAAGVLASRGLIERDGVNEFVDKIAEDVSSVWDVVEKMASSFSADDLGSVSTQKTASDTMVDPFEREFFGRNVNSTGMID